MTELEVSVVGWSGLEHAGGLVVCLAKEARLAGILHGVGQWRCGAGMPVLFCKLSLCATKVGDAGF